MYKLNIVGKECEILLSNESHKLVWDGRAYVIREKVVRKNKEGEMEVFYDPKFYYSNLNSVINKLAMMKLLTNEEAITFTQMAEQLNESRKEVVDNLRKVFESYVSTDNGTNIED